MRDRWLREGRCRGGLGSYGSSVRLARSPEGVRCSVEEALVRVEDDRVAKRLVVVLKSSSVVEP